MTQPKCPEIRDLRSFVRCSLTEEELESINEHLATCPTCEETVVGLEKSADTIAERIRNSPPIPFADEPECQQLLAAIEAGELTTGRLHRQEQFAAPPHAVRDYQLLELLGQGGMGQVHRAVHQRLKRFVAIKLLSSARLKDQSAIARFEREMAVLGRLDHPHIVRAQDAGEHEGQHYLVMEYVDGVDLGELVRRDGQLPLAEACLLIRQAAIGLQYAHERGCVHRDIKPSNLMLAKTDGGAIVKILDLGLARALEENVDHGQQVTELTTANQIMGTLDYMAPEQGDDSHIVDIRADIYSLGATLYKLLTGEGPHAAHAGKPPMQRLLAMAKNDPPQIQSKRSEVPAPLASVVHRMLARDPAQRFTTPAEVASALEPFCRGADLARMLNGEPIATSAVSAVAEPKTVSANPPRRTFTNWSLGFAGFVAAMLLGVVLHFTTRNGTITIESPDGPLPPDVKVVVSQSGENVAVLQADNHWSLTLENGKYRLQLQSGDDQFTLTQSEVTLSRLGRKAITIRVEKSVPPANVASDATAQSPTPPPAEHTPPAVPDQTANVTPVALVHADGSAREFVSIHEAVDLQKAGDVIEIRSSARIKLQLKYQPPGPLHLRAAAGFRPTIVFEEVPREGIGQDLTIEGCDLDLRKLLPWHLAQHSVTIKSCRIWGYLRAITGAHVSVQDSILVPYVGFDAGSEGPTVEIELENCAIRNGDSVMNVGGGKHSLTLKICTYHAENNGRPALVQFHGTNPAHVDIESTGCVFYCRSQSSGIIDLDDMPKVTWKGDNNCYTGEFYRIFEPTAENQYHVKEEGFDAWLKRWNTEEPKSYEAKDLQFVWNEMEYGNFAEKLPQIEQAVRRITPQPQHPEFGPEWSLIGSGAAYARVLQGTSDVDMEALRQPGLPDGRIILIRDGKPARGYLTLQEAVDAAQDKDVIEIRIQGPIPGCNLNGDARLLTIRAGIGFEPQIAAGSFNNLGSDRLILEGLHFEGATTFSKLWSPPNWSGTDPTSPLFPGSGGVVRLQNCTSNGNLSGWFFSTETLKPQVENCAIDYLAIGLKAGNEINVSNSVFQGIGINNESSTSLPPTARITRCVTWQPLPRQLAAKGAVENRTPITCSVSDSFLLSSQVSLLNFSGGAVSWNGSGNIYCKPYDFGFGKPFTFRLDDLRQQGIAEPDSIELPPFEFDPAIWRISAESSPSYHKKSDGTDFGVDVDALQKTFSPVAP